MDILFLAIVGIVFAGIVIAVIIFAFRRASAMNDELSKQAKIKFDAIKPTSAFQKETPKETQVPSPARLAMEQRPQAPSYLGFMSEVQDNRRKLERQAQDIAASKERETTNRSEIETLKNEIVTLRDRLSSSGQELQKLRTLIEEQNTKLQSQRRDIESQAREFRDSLEGYRKALAKTMSQPSPPVPPTPSTSISPSAPTAQQTVPPPPTTVIQGSRESGASRFFGKIFGRMTCTKCGRPLRRDDSFCDLCGQAVAGSSV